MRSRLCIAILTLAAALAGEKHSATVKAKLKQAEKAEKARDFSTEKRLYEEALKEEPQSIELLQAAAWVAREECRWKDGLLLLKQARDLARKKDEIHEIEERMIWLNTSRLHAPPDLYCGSPYVVKPPAPVKRVMPDPPLNSDLPPGGTKVSIWAEVGPDGVPGNLQALPAGDMGALALEAMKAAAQWRFRPATLDGKAVRVAVRIEVNFVRGR